MAQSDIFALVITLAIVSGVVFVVLYINRGINNTLQTTKENLKSRGYNISSSGISIKTDKRLGHEEYLDATQRGLLRALGASTTGDGSRPALGRFSQAQQATYTVNSDESTAKHGKFSLGHHAKSSNTTNDAESTGRHGEHLLGRLNVGHHAKQCDTTTSAESTGRHTEESEKRHLWKGKHAEKDAL